MAIEQVCKNGHLLTQENTYSTGLCKDICLTCYRESAEFARFLRSVITPHIVAKLRRDDEWKYQALCRDNPDVDMFPTTGKPMTQQRKLCAECPVRAQCFTVGLFERHGIWGGFSATEREEMRNGHRDIPYDLLGVSP